MEIERRERDPDTGEIMGGGFSDVFGKIAAKLTGKTAQKLATKAAEKAAEKVGEKTGQLVGEKIYEKFATKPTGQTELKSAPADLKSAEFEDRPPETKGKEIGKMLAALSRPQPAKNFAPAKDERSEMKLKINNIYADLL